MSAAETGVTVAPSGTESESWAVFPVGRDKVPLVRWREESRPRREWDDWPEGTNAGIDCGKSGLVVIDQDREGAVREWLGYEPETYTVQTGRPGGRHYYFTAVDGPEVRNQAGVAHDVDVRGVGGLVVAPGSLHDNGTRYQVVRDVVPAPLPDDLRRRLTGSTAPPAAPGTPAGAGAGVDAGASPTLATVDLSGQPWVLPDRIEEGQRNDTLYRYASSLAGRGLPQDEALVLLRAAWDRCVPSYTDTTPEQMWERVRGEYPSNADRDHERAVEQRLRFLRVDEDARARLAEEQAAEGAEAWSGITGDQFDPDSVEPEPCVLEYAEGRYLFSAGVTSVFGPRSSAKTWLCYEAVAQEARRGHPALIVDYEMDYNQSMRRLLVLGVDAEAMRHVVYVKPPGPLGDAGRAQLVRRFSEPPTVVVVDSVGMGMGASGLNSNDDTEVAEWLAGVPLWMKTEWPGAAVLLVDHVPKGSGGVVNDPIGSQRKGAAADHLFSAQVLAPFSRSVRGTGRLTVTKDRSGWSEEGAPLLDFHFGGGGPFELAAVNPGLALVDLSVDESVLRRIAASVGSAEGQTVEQVRNALGVQSSEFTRLKNLLVDKGVLTNPPRRGLHKGPDWQMFMDQARGTGQGT